MEGGFVGDSTYGSLSGRQSSSSSFTMSLSGSDTFEDHPSTSGCSSDMTNYKEKRKQRVKQYLRELKALVPPGPTQVGKIGTVSALQHVVNSMKKIQEENRVSTLKNEVSLDAGLSKTLFEYGESLCHKSLVTKDCLHITLAVKDLTIKQVTSNITDVLGYPVKSWQNRSLRNFVYRKDIVTLTTSLSANTKDDESPASLNTYENMSSNRDGKKTFYFRMRHYKNLQSGFNIAKRDKFTAFQATIIAASKTKKSKYIAATSSSKESTDDSPVSAEETETQWKDKKAGEFMLLECVPLKSAYLGGEGNKSNTSFNTRHTLFCNYSYIHPRAIPLLGYLPQDMNQMSIFDFYHPDDMESLYNTYKQVVNSRGTPFKSPPFRLRARNGCWVFVETEWSSFTNPWTHRLEFIIGQHTVVRQPQDPNVFNEQKIIPINEITENVRMLQQKIRDILLQPVSQDRVASVATDVVKKELTSDDVTEEPNWKKDFCEEAPSKPQQKKASLESESLEDSDEMLLPQDEMSIVYEQLNYTNNIKRFLYSQPGSFSSSNGTDLEPPAPREESGFDVISILKPPSFGSSTKVLLSEHEQREDMTCSSPTHHLEDSVTDEPTTGSKDTGQTITPSSAAEQMDQSKVLILTQDVLMRHTKIQEKMYVNCARQDQKFPLHADSGRNSNVETNRMKRSHSPDVLQRGVGKHTKTSRPDDDNFLTPPFPLCNVDSLQRKTQGHNTKSITKDGSHGIYPAGIPLVPLDTAGMLPNYNTFTTPKQQWQSFQQTPVTSQGKMQWLYYPQSGVSFFPQVMTGFYQPVPQFSQPMDVSRVHPTTMQYESCNTTATSGINTSDQGNVAPRHRAHTSARGAGISQMTYSTAGNYNRGKVHSSSISSEISSSADDTSSSILYLLEPDNPASSSSIEENAAGKGRASSHAQVPRLTEPLWLQNVNWSPKIAMTYMMPKCKQTRVLKKDREAIMKQTNSEILLEQMKILESEIAEVKEWRTYDEEQDYLFCISEEEKEDTKDLQTLENSGDDSDSSLCGLDHNHGVDNINLNALSFEKDDYERKMESQVTSAFEKSPMNSVTTEDRIQGGESRENECNMVCDIELQQKCDGDFSSVEYESDYSKSSDITPSDQRSSEEAASSLKESDTTSSKSSQEENNESKESTKGSDSPSSSTEDVQKESFDSFFVPLPVKFLNRNKAKVPWLMDTEMNKLVEMKYQIDSNSLQSRLSDDKRHMKGMMQPDLVKEQFKLMMEEKGQILQRGVSDQSGRKCQSQEHELGATATDKDDDFFEGLFVNLFDEELLKNSAESKVSDARDMMLCLDGVD